MHPAVLVFSAIGARLGPKLPRADGIREQSCLGIRLEVRPLRIDVSIVEVEIPVELLEDQLARGGLAESGQLVEIRER